MAAETRQRRIAVMQLLCGNFDFFGHAIVLRRGASDASHFSHQSFDRFWLTFGETRSVLGLHASLERIKPDAVWQKSHFCGHSQGTRT